MKQVMLMNEFRIFLKFGLLLLALIICRFGFSQEAYVPGYIIKSTNDTIFGFVDYRNWERNPDKINFKTKNGSSSKSYNSLQIKEFKVENEIYVSAIVEAETSPLETSALKAEQAPNIIIDTIFLQTRFEGKKSLYFHKRRDGRENFYIKQDRGYHLLFYKRYLKQNGDKQMLTENTRFLNQLNFYLSDCSMIKSKLKTTKYTKKSLTQLFQYYYECSQTELYFEKEIEKIKIETGVLVAASLTSLQFTSSYFLYLADTEFSRSINPSFGIFLGFILPRNQGKWSIYNELLFTTYEVRAKHVDLANPEKYVITETELGHSYINLNNFISYKHPVGKYFIFFNAGISHGLAFREINVKYVEDRFYTTHTFSEGRAVLGTRKLEQRFILGSGVKLNKISLEVRYENGNGMSNLSFLTSSSRRFHFLLGYRL